MQPVRDRLTYLMGGVRERTGIVGPIKRLEKTATPLLERFQFRGGITTAAEELPVTEPAEVVPASITQEEQFIIADAEAKQKAEIASTGVRTPQHVGTHTNWQGDSAEVWYYPEEALYGVILPNNTSLNTGPKYASLSDAVAYARGALGMK